MMKLFYGRNDFSNYSLSTIFMKVSNNSTEWNFETLDLCNTQLFGQIDIKPFRTSDFINKVILYFPIFSHSNDITFKLYETLEYNFYNLPYSSIDSSDLSEIGIVYDSLISSGNSISCNYGFLEFDITRLFQKCVKQGLDKVCFRIINNSTLSVQAYNPRSYNINTRILVGYFSIPYIDSKKYDVIDFNSFVGSFIDTKERTLICDLPTISTKSRVGDLSFSGCINNGRTGHLGKYASFNYEFLIRRDSNDISSRYRYVITDYRGIESYYVLLKSQEILDEYGIEVENSEAFFNIKELSYLTEDDDYITIINKDGVEIYFSKVNIANTNAFIYIHHIIYRSSIIYFIWNNNKLSYICDDIEFNNRKYIEYRYTNNVINKVFFNVEKKLIKLDYSGSEPKLTGLKIYKASSIDEINENNIISNISFEYRLTGTDYLYKAKDNINDSCIMFNYIDNTSYLISSINHTIGMGDQINYNYDSLNKIAMITNKYNEYKKIVFDCFDNVSICFDENHYYQAYTYEKTIGNIVLQSQKSLDYRYFNILSNSKFENGLNNWLQQNITTSDSVINNTFITDIIGSSVLKLSDASSNEKKIYQIINNHGIIGDSHFVSFWTRGPFSQHNKIKGFITYFNLATEDEDTTYIDVLENIGDFQIVSGIGCSKINYDMIRVGVEYNGYNECEVGNIRCYEKEKGNDYIFNNEGKLDSLIINGDVIEYQYENDRLERIISSSGDSFDFSYNSDEISKIENLNTSFKKEFEIDDFKNKTKIKEVNDNGKIIEQKNEYDDNNNLVVEKNEREFYTFHTYNNYNELIHSVYPSGVTRKIEYGTNGNISKSLFMLNNKKDGACFTYDNKNRLKEILVQNDTKYQYSYDSLNRLSSFSFINGNNSQPIISYAYNKSINNQDTDLITEKKYFNSNSDKYNFSYNDKRLLTNISYNGGTKYTFSYDSSDRLINIIDINNDYVKTLSYDNNDNLLSVTAIDSHDNEVLKEEYHYDNYGNLQQSVIACDCDVRSYEYDYTNEYCEYNLNSYLSRVSSSTLNDHVSSVDGKSMYGEAPQNSCASIFYDSTIKRKVIRFDSSSTTCLCYNVSDFNKNRLNNKDYCGNLYNQNDWKILFNNRKAIFGWFRFSGSNTITKDIYNFTSESTLKYKLHISSNNLYIYRSDVNEIINTHLSINPSDWNLIGICLDNNIMTIVLNEDFYEDFGINQIIIQSIDRLDVCFEANSSITTDLLYLNIGPEFYKYNFDKIYADGINYLSGYKVNKKSATMYYNKKAYKSCDVITLNGTIQSREGIMPVDYIFTNPEFSKDKTKFFMYDEDLGRHVYASYSNYKTYYGMTHSSLGYKFPYGMSGTLSMWFKLDSGTFNHNRYIFYVRNNNTEKLACFVGTDNKIYVTSFNNPMYGYNLPNPTNWNLISIIWDDDTLIIGINGSINSVYFNTPINLTNAITFIGHKSVANESASDHLEGKIQLVCFSSSVISERELYDIEDYGYVIDVRKEYDNDDRLIKRRINTINHNLDITYSYYEPDNKLNRLPSNEVDYNNIKTIYAYDEDGNIIEKRILNGSTILEKYLYEYNELKELKKETHYNNNQFDYSYEYEYNINGNRTKVTSYDETESVLSEDVYTYSNVYKDRLESLTHNNTTLYSFSYQGSNFLNPSSITINNNIYNLTWQGRRLTSINNTTFSYNEDGIRILKTTPYDETRYYVSGINVVRSKFNDYNDNEYIIDYHYDESGSLIGLHYDGKEYFYKKDILGIINEIIDEEGTPFVYYKYTAFGIPTKTINTNLSQDNQQVANILIKHNIYIYKDYIYDNDISLYYLNSRYYDPYIGRFISIDAIEYLDIEIVNGLNLYAYCMNNPVMYDDIYGNAPKWWQWIVSGVELVGGIAFCFVPGCQALGVGLIAAGSTSMLSNIISSTGVEGKTACIITSCLDVATGVILCCIGFGGLGASYIGSGIGGIGGGFVAEALGGSYEVGSFIGNIVGGIVGSKVYNKIQTYKIAQSGKVVIGEKVHRVSPKAKELGASEYNGLSHYKKLEKIFGGKIMGQLGLAHNQNWMACVVQSGCEIIDIGPVGPIITSPYYAIEILTWLGVY